MKANGNKEKVIKSTLSAIVNVMVLTLDSNSEHVVHVSKKNQICDCSRSNQMP